MWNKVSHCPPMYTRCLKNDIDVGRCSLEGPQPKFHNFFGRNVAEIEASSLSPRRLICLRTTWGNANPARIFVVCC